MIAMTYGTLPTVELFYKQFEEKCPEGTFKIENSKTLGWYAGTSTVVYNCGELWTTMQDICAHAHEAYNESDSEQLLDLASGVMTSLGFEWI